MDTLIGRRFGSLTVESRASNRRDKVWWMCRCACGAQHEVRADQLRGGEIKSCGCLQYLRSRDEKLAERLLANRTITASGCWEWNKTCGSTGGYGKTQVNGKTVFVHRVAAMLWMGYRPSQELRVLHRCDNPPCFNPDHLFIGTQSDNVRDCVKKGRQKEARKTECPQGHPYTAENTRIENGKRKCRECCRERTRQWQRIHGKDYRRLKRTELLARTG